MRWIVHFILLTFICWIALPALWTPGAWPSIDLYFSVNIFLDVHFRPFSGKEENTLRSKRQSLLSEVIFIQPSECTIPSSDLPRSPTKQKR